MNFEKEADSEQKSRNAPIVVNRGRALVLPEYLEAKRISFQGMDREPRRKGSMVYLRENAVGSYALGFCRVERILRGDTEVDSDANIPAAELVYEIERFGQKIPVQHADIDFDTLKKNEISCFEY